MLVGWTSDTSSESSSGYGSTHQIGKYGSLNSMMSPSAMLASSYVSSDVKQPTNDSSSEKPRDRSVGGLLYEIKCCLFVYLII